MLIKNFLLCSFIALTGATSVQAANDYPDKPVRVYVGFAPGGATDLLARYYSDQLSQAMGQRFIVENRAGSGGNVAIQAKSDGYTITGLEPIKALPGIPTLNQTGLKGFNVGASYLLMAPAGVPTEVISRLSSAVATINAAPETIAFNDRIFAPPMVGGPIQAKEFLESEYQKWSKLVKENNLQID